MVLSTNNRLHSVRSPCQQESSGVPCLLCRLLCRLLCHLALLSMLPCPCCRHDPLLIPFLWSSPSLSLLFALEHPHRLCRSYLWPRASTCHRGPRGEHDDDGGHPKLGDLTDCRHSRSCPKARLAGPSHCSKCKRRPANRRCCQHSFHLCRTCCCLSPLCSLCLWRCCPQWRSSSQPWLRRVSKAMLHSAQFGNLLNTTQHVGRAHAKMGSTCAFTAPMNKP
mmetsp:Transcript_14386/g.31794  ORF Transcript_14386/g.31794 Transcript_14386/m.31794 type:complete len:222 (+) Transcript_14386:740-1405(+)